MKANAVAKRRLRASLKAQGSSAEVIEKTIKDTFGGEDGPKLKAIPRTVTRNMLVLFNKLGHASTVAVSWGKTGKFRVFSEEGYKSLMAHGKRVGSLPKKAKYHVAAAAAK